MFNQKCHCLEIEWPIVKVCKMLNMLNAAPQSVTIRRTHSEQLCKVMETAIAESSSCFTVAQMLSQPNEGVHLLLC